MMFIYLETNVYDFDTYLPQEIFMYFRTHVDQFERKVMTLKNIHVSQKKSSYIFQKKKEIREMEIKK